MPAFGDFLFFLLAALVISLTPGPGLLYVAARTLAAGRREGVASTLGLALGGGVHVVGGALGVSALLVASAEAFTLFKILGALYLIWLGIKTFRGSAPAVKASIAPGVQATARRAFRDGVVVEVLNPKTAAFFLAFVPQFVDPSAGPVFLQFLLLGAITVLLNALADLLMILGADRLGRLFLRRPQVYRRVRQGAGLAYCGLGVSLALVRRPV